MATSPLRLRSNAVTVLLGPAPERRGVLDALDPGTTRCAGGHRAAARRLTCGPWTSADERAQALRDAAAEGPVLLLADGLGTGLDRAERRVVLDALREVSRTGVAVLVEDDDPVSVLSVADAALRVGADGSLQDEDLQPRL